MSKCYVQFIKGNSAENIHNIHAVLYEVGSMGRAKEMSTLVPSKEEC